MLAGVDWPSGVAPSPRLLAACCVWLSRAPVVSSGPHAVNTTRSVHSVLKLSLYSGRPTVPLTAVDSGYDRPASDAGLNPSQYNMKKKQKTIRKKTLRISALDHLLATGEAARGSEQRPPVPTPAYQTENGVSKFAISLSGYRLNAAGLRPLAHLGVHCTHCTAIE
jgi:hypothetical protein